MMYVQNIRIIYIYKYKSQSVQCVIVKVNKKKRERESEIPLLSSDLFLFVKEDVEVLSLCVFIFDEKKTCFLSEMRRKLFLTSKKASVGVNRALHIIDGH